LIHDESQDHPTDETPTPDEENVEPTTAPDEPPADAPADADDVTQVEEERGPQPDQAEGEPEDAPAEAEAPQEPAPQADAPQEPAPQADAPQEERRPPRREQRKADEPEVIPGAHLEPDLVLEQPAADADAEDYSQYAVADEDETETEAAAPEPETAAVRSPLELAADARYHATGKRKSAIARVVLKPGSGVYTINGKALDVYFPRERLQVQARQPLDATGNLARMDVVARIHGGGVSAQAGALRHGIARALVEAEPTLRTELKRRGYLTRDPRETERKKAGLKKARKRPQFSKR
jgi:small subunit ribosomal protein S9